MEYEVLKGFILKNGFEGKVGAILNAETFVGEEANSLVVDGSLKEIVSGEKVDEKLNDDSSEKDKGESKLNEQV